MSEDNVLMGVGAAALAAVGAYFHELLLPLTLLVTVMVCDYASGMIRAWELGVLDSKTGLKGIVKKVAYMFAVAVAMAADWVVQISAQEAGISFDGVYFCALLVTVWLILNECISILENVSDIGVPVPGFLMALVQRLKKTAEKRGEERADDER